MQDTHRREQIIDAFTTLFDVLTEDTADSGYPIKAEVVQNRWAHMDATFTARRAPRVDCDAR